MQWINQKSLICYDFGKNMNRENDIEISKLVIEKKLLLESLKRNTNEFERKEIKKKIMLIDGMIFKSRHLDEEMRKPVYSNEK